MNTPTEKVSIIMPVYNTSEAYMSVAVRSVLGQTYDNIELILVDDGSERSCAEYCDSLARTDGRIKVIHQRNAGVSRARNLGTERATGSYVMYVDSDDIIKQTAVEEGVNCISETGASFVFAAIQHIAGYDEAFQETDAESKPEYRCYRDSELDRVRSAFLALRYRDFQIGKKGFVNRGPCARLIRKELAAKVKFNEKLRIGEDVEWNFRLLNESKSVCFVRSIWYGYLVYENSSLRKYYGNRAELLEEYHRMLYEANREFCDNHMDDFIYNVIISFYSMVQFEYLSEQNPQSAWKKNKEIRQMFQRFPWNLMLDKSTRKSIPVQYRLFLYACRIGCGLWLLNIWGSMKSVKR